MHMVGAPAGWAGLGGVWTAKCVEAMCEPWGLALKGVVKQVSALWAQRAGEAVRPGPATNRVGQSGRRFATVATQKWSFVSPWHYARPSVPRGSRLSDTAIRKSPALLVPLTPIRCPYVARTHKSNTMWIHLFVDQAPMLHSVVCMDEGCRARGHPRCVRQIVPFEVAITYLPFPVSAALDPAPSQQQTERTQ